MRYYPNCMYCGKFVNPEKKNTGSVIVGSQDFPPYPGEQMFYHNSCKSNLTENKSRNGKKPYCCPVCNGNGQVPNGFYNQVSGVWATSSITPETCRSCNGTGVLWSKDSEIVLK